MKVLAEYNGTNGIITVYDDMLVISKKTFGGLVAQKSANAGERRFFWEDITGINYRKPSLFANGLFKVIAAGTADTNTSAFGRKAALQELHDPNAVMVRYSFFKNKAIDTDKVYKLIMEKFTAAKKAKQTASAAGTTISSSKMDELKKLGELKAAGVLSEEEFQKEKAKLLAI